MGQYESNDTTPRSLYVGGIYLLTVTSVVIGLVRTDLITWCPENPTFINFYLEKKWTVVTY